MNTSAEIVATDKLGRRSGPRRKRDLMANPVVNFSVLLALWISQERITAGFIVIFAVETITLTSGARRPEAARRA
jgi:hypothetical protein